MPVLGITDWVAIYGAVAGTLALLIQVLDHLNRRGLLRIAAEINCVRDTAKDRWKTNLVLVVTNTGEVPVLVRHVALQIGDYSSHLRVDEVLQPSQFFRCGLDLDDQGHPPSRRRKVWVEDGRGREWRVRNWWLLWRRRNQHTISDELEDGKEPLHPAPEVWLDKEGLGKSDS